MAVMLRLRSAFDPSELCNPGKAFPTPRLCGEVPGPYRQHPAERDGVRAAVINHSPGDLIATVSADVGLAELNAELATAGQMLALDPPGADRLTVAEVFDQALSGPRSHRYGEPRDLVLGMEIELSDGTVARSGGRVVKSVAGYDLPKLFTGAHGRLGRIRELTVRLHPVPQDTATVVCDQVDVLSLEPLAPACVEYSWPPEVIMVRFESPVAAALAARMRADTGGELIDRRRATLG